ncbi:MAG TPA: DUF4157 domain-containing protein [Roseiflexaceae bacterium]|nr:DUF4157 domain-containing protein [Roseiflexaceae bacterium]
MSRTTSRSRKHNEPTPGWSAPPEHTAAPAHTARPTIAPAPAQDNANPAPAPSYDFASMAIFSEATAAPAEQFAGDGGSWSAGLSSGAGSTFGGTFLQASLRVNAPDDPFEQEAEHMADTVMRMPAGPEAGPAPDAPGLRVQRATAGDAGGTETSPAVEASIGRMQGGGSPLPAGERSFFENRFGHDFSQVRIHADSGAADTARSLNARAFTVGNDIAFDAGEYQPGTESGRHLLAHELTHTIQQTGGVATKRVQRFEAQHHEHVERGALSTPTASGGPGFTDAEATATYFGNWSRDMNQAFSNNPITAALGKELVFEIINVLAMQKFGRQLNPEDFGVYSPREHMDNPAGQINADLLRGEQERTFQQFQEKPAQPEDISTEEAVRQLFVVNDAGLPAYIGRSIQYVEEQFSTAADSGRTADGLMHFGNGLHTVEDLFAHSNYIEIAIGKLITDGALTLDPDLSEEMDQRREQGLDPIETLAGETTDGRPILTTGSFVTDDTLISVSEAITAFLNDFSPFSPSNSERSQEVMTMILGRYEELADSGEAGRILIPFIQTMGSALTTKLAEAAEQAVAGEQPGEDASLWDRAVSTVRGAAGSLVGGALSLAGSLLQNGWVQDMIASAVNGFGQLPLVEIYQFIMDKVSSIKSFFKWIDSKLEGNPVYDALKSFVKEQMDALRELLKPLITNAVQFVGSLIQKSFSEAEAEKTNIQQQINTLISEKVRDPEARRQLESAGTPEAQMALLANADWSRRAQLSPNDLERLRQMLQTPEYVKAGPSHTQIAKDHADSPFFGTAAVLAGHVDQQMRDKLIAVWEAEGNNRQVDPALQKNYAGEIPPELAARLPAPGTPESQLTYEQREALREAQKGAYHYHEHVRRQEGEQLLRDGALPEGEEDHGGEAGYNALTAAVRVLGREILALPETLRSVAARLETAAGDAAASLRHLADQLPRGIEDLIGQVESAPAAEAPALAARLREMAREKADLIARAQRTLNQVAGVVERADPAMDDVAGAARQLAQQLEPLVPRIGPAFGAVADAMAERGERGMRSQAQLDHVHGLAPVQTGQWDAELAASHGRAADGQAMSPERAALFGYVREIMNHPYDSTWWHGPLLAWCEQNKERLEAYIRARNTGEMHHHEH